jgi:RimK family alpha-L-glutamate ligase
MEERGIEPVSFSFSDISVRVASKPEITIKNNIDALKDLKAVIVRPIGRGSLDEVIFRLDYLHRMERLGLPVINSPSSIEKAVDKYYALTLLEENGIKIPPTIVTEHPKKALDAFNELGEDIVVKPIFGSRGMGITRVSDPEVAGRIFRSLSYHHYVLYIQKFIPHGTRDIRVFVVGDRAIAAMYRIAESWKTNISQGAKAVPFIPHSELKNIAIKATRTMGCQVAGVDIMEGPNGYLVTEINSQPGFRGLQSTTKVDVAGEIVDHVLTNFCR